MSHTTHTASRYGGGTGPPKTNVLERIFSKRLNSCGQPMKPPKQENPLESDPAIRTLS